MYKKERNNKKQQEIISFLELTLLHHFCLLYTSSHDCINPFKTVDLIKLKQININSWTTEFNCGINLM